MEICPLLYCISVGFQAPYEPCLNPCLCFPQATPSSSLPLFLTSPTEPRRSVPRLSCTLPNAAARTEATGALPRGRIPLYDIAVHVRCGRAPASGLAARMGGRTMTSSGAARGRTGGLRVVVGGEEGVGRHVCAAWGVSGRGDAEFGLRAMVIWESCILGWVWGGFSRFALRSTGRCKGWRRHAASLPCPVIAMSSK